MAEVTKGTRGVFLDDGGAVRNVKHGTYGAKGDGTTDDAAAIQAAIDAGGVVYIPAGRYRLATVPVISSSNVEIRTAGDATVLVPDDGVRALEVVGTAASYLEGVQVGGFRIERPGAEGNVFIRYARHCRFGKITATGGTSVLLNLRDSDENQFDGIILTDSSSGSAVFALRSPQNQFDFIMGARVQDAVDLFDCSYTTIGKLLAIECDEALDMGNSSWCSFGQITAINCTRGISIKVETTGGKSVHNVVGHALMYEPTAHAVALSAGTATPDGTEEVSYNTVEELHVLSTTAGCQGVKMSAPNTGMRSQHNRLGHVWIKVPGLGVSVDWQDDFRLDSGYVESTAAEAIQFDVGNSRPYVGPVRFRGVPASSAGAVDLALATEYTLDGVHVLESSGLGIRAPSGGTIRGFTVEECQLGGILINISAAVTVPLKITDGHIQNINKATGFNYGIDLKNSSAGTVSYPEITGVSFRDTQGTATTRGMRFSGAFDFLLITGLRNLGGLIQTVSGLANVGSSSVVQNNKGLFTTYNRSTDTISSSVTVVTVTHGLSFTPDLSEIQVTPQNNLGSATKFWVSNPTSSYFDINVDAAPGSGGAVFSWQARVRAA